MVSFGWIEFVLVGRLMVLYFFKYFDYGSEVHLSYLEMVWCFYSLLEDSLGLRGVELSQAGSFPPLRQDPMLCEREAPWSSGGGRHVSSPVGREVCVLLLDLPGGSSRAQGLPSHCCRDTAAYLSGPLPVPPVLAPSSVPLNAACPLSSVWLLTSWAWASESRTSPFS